MIMSTINLQATKEQIDKQLRYLLNSRILWYCLECDVYIRGCDEECAICGGRRQWAT